ncbi:hypothetical protein FWD20_03925, partial [Candidatus Saccharibacteria bacterium]|nr:hypothetical protein [Candidatus Saccharibacteria bacterium]
MATGTAPAGINSQIYSWWYMGSGSGTFTPTTGNPGLYTTTTAHTTTNPNLRADSVDGVSLKNMTYRTTSADVGKMFCQRAEAWPQSNTNATKKIVDPAPCVRVVLPWSITPKTSMRITAGNTTSGAWVTSASGSDYNSGSG